MTKQIVEFGTEGENNGSQVTGINSRGIILGMLVKRFLKRQKRIKKVFAGGPKLQSVLMHRKQIEIYCFG
jgi:hypothetical protein